MFSAATSDDVRRLNLARLLRQLHLEGSLTRSELVSSTGLNRSTVAGLITDLAEAGLVKEVAGQATGVGRPSLGVEPISTSAFVAAFDLGVDRITAAIIGLGGEVLLREQTTVATSASDPQAMVERITDLCEAMFLNVPDGAAWVGTGVSLPGVVDPASGLVRVAPNLGWSSVELTTLLSDALSARFSRAPQIALGNDANLGALAECSRGVGRAQRNLVYITGDVGVGGGVIVDGHLLAGTTGFGGEVGHLIVNPSGRQCRCGNRGCWETEIGRDAVLRACGRDDLTTIVADARAGDEAVLMGLKEISTWLGLGLVNLVNTFDPQVIAIGGPLGQILLFFGDDVRGQVTHGWDLSSRDLVVVPSALGAEASVIGAGELAFSELLGNPIGHLEASPHLVSQ